MKKISSNMVGAEAELDNTMPFSLIYLLTTDGKAKIRLEIITPAGMVFVVVVAVVVVGISLYSCNLLVTKRRGQVS